MNDIRITEEAMAHEAFESERAQAVTLLHVAADRLEVLAEHFQRYVDNFDENANWPNGAARFDSPTDAWQYDNTERLGSKDALAWIAALSPVVAPHLAGWLRKAALIATTQQNQDAFRLYVDIKALKFAQHVMAARP